MKIEAKERLQSSWSCDGEEYDYALQNVKIAHRIVTTRRLDISGNPQIRHTLDTKEGHLFGTITKVGNKMVYVLNRKQESK